jgi:hypothetical protein
MISILFSRLFDIKTLQIETVRSRNGAEPMGKLLDARTDWELEAARRRELINSDLETRRLLREAGASMNPSIAEPSGGMFAGLRTAFGGPADKVEDGPCPPATAGGMTAVKPGT